jgi:hypothetical protein
MRAMILIAGAALGLAACGNNDQKDNNLNVDENLTAESIVSNDVTAIDAVTGDAANMAADVDMNYGGLDVNSSEATTNAPAAKPAKPSPPRTSTAAESNTTTNAVANSQ